MKFSELKSLRWHNFFKTDIGLPILLPFLGYILFGIGNIFFFSLALKKIPTASAFAVWTAVSIILMKAAEILFFKDKITFVELFFIFLITAGIAGLKFYSPS